MIHEIAPHCFDNQYTCELPKPESFALYYDNRLSLVKKTSQGIEFPTFKELEELKAGIYQDATYLFSIDGQGYFLVSELKVSEIIGDETNVGENNEHEINASGTRVKGLPDFTLEDINIFRFPFNQGISIDRSRSWPGQVEVAVQPTQSTAYAGIAGYQLYTWYKDNQYCGRCKEVLEKDFKERMLRCRICDNMVYPRLNPAVIVGVTHKNRIILSRYKGQPKNTYALVAGFIEFGESLEEGVKREVLEEVGLHVTNIRYYKSQPWPFTSSLLMGFYCDVINGEEEIVLDADELSLAQWFEREDIPVEFNNISLTNEMIVAFKNGEV